MKPIINILSDAEVEAIHQASLTILRQYGVSVGSATARDILQTGGCRVDNQRVYYPASLVEAVIGEIPKGFRLYGLDTDKVVDYSPGHTYFRPSGGLPFVLDYARRQRRPATFDDAVMFVRLLDCLDGFAIANAVVSPGKAPSGFDNLRRFVSTHRNSTKPSDITVMSPREVRGIARLAAAFRGGQDALRQQPLSAVYISPVSPLDYAADQADALIEASRLGLPVILLPCPTLSLTCPITLAGALAQQNAEFLAGMVLAFLVAPDVQVAYANRISIGDPRTACSTFGGPEIGLSSVGAVQLATRYGFGCNAYGLGTSAKVPNHQAGVEKAINGLLMVLAGGTMVSGGGCLDEALTTSAEQLVIDDEIISMLRRTVAETEVNQDTLALEMLPEAVAAGTFLGEEHTVRHLRAGALWIPQLFTPISYEAWDSAGRPDVFDLAHQQVEELLDSWEPVTFSSKVEAEVEDVLMESKGEFAAASED